MGSRPGTPAEESRADGRILIIDDEDDVRLALQAMLSLDGWDTEEATSGAEAVAQVGRTPEFDALVVDYKMPGLDGMELTRRIRGSGFERPIIICSAYLNPDIEREASALRAGTVSKDDLNRLREEIRRQVPAHRPEQDQRAFRPGPIAEPSEVVGGASTTGSETERNIAERRTRAILNTAHEAFVAADQSGAIIDWNPHAERTFGWARAEALGRPLAGTLIPPRYREAHARGLERFLATGRKSVIGKRLELHALHRDGHEFPIELTVGAMYAEGGWQFNAFIRDISERQRAEQNFQSLLESAPDAAVIVGADGLIALVNRQTEELFGHRREELLGKPMEVLVPERFRDRLPHQRNRYFAGPKARPMGAGLELYAIRKDGTEFPVEISLSPLKSEGGTIISAAIRDVTERKSAEEKLEKALATEQDASDRLRELDRLKDEFLSTVSHELRTPLTAISALAEVLRDSVTNQAQQADMLERICQNASDMTVMIEQLLDYSRLEAGKVSLEVGPLPLLDAAAHCIGRARGAIGQRQTLLKVPDHLKVQADERGFERILVNLLTNAAKFSPEDSTIRVTAREENGKATIAVEDEGIGIPPEEQKSVFERFYQGSEISATRGTGIGLSIVRRYVELHGGEVWVESKPGQGSKFLFTLALSARLERSAG